MSGAPRRALSAAPRPPAASVTALLAAALLAACGPEEIPRGMKAIPGGRFRMGEAGLSEPVHDVAISPFDLDSAPVTQGAYEALMGANPSHFRGDPLRPVETVTWFDAVLFCNARSKAESRDTVYAYSGVEGRPGNGCVTLRGLRADRAARGYRLPTEAEYEYAARAGTTGEFFWGDTLDGDYLWYYANADGTTQPVARKRPNAFGLYDMNGNLWEWTGDWWAPYGTEAAEAAEPARDPAGPDTGSYRVLRGGSWYTYAPYIVGSAFRYHLESAPRLRPPRDYYGFRCAMSKR